MKHFFFIFLIALAMGCQEKGRPPIEKEKLNTLSFVNNKKSLLLHTVNDRCGEWGGDTESILIYSGANQKVLLADYTKVVMQCDKPYLNPTDGERIKMEGIIMVDETKLIAEQCIKDLVEMKLANNAYVSHAGRINKAIMSDSSFVIIDFPSRRWNKFFVLRDRLLLR